MAAGPILSIQPAPGLIDPDPTTARWTPIVASVQGNSSPAPYVFASIGTFNWCIYDSGAGAFLPMFTERSSVVLDGSGNWTITILPNGGWWRSGITIKFVAGAEL